MEAAASAKVEAAVVVECGGGSNSGGMWWMRQQWWNLVEATTMVVETIAMEVETAEMMDWRLRQQQRWLGGGGDMTVGLEV